MKEYLKRFTNTGTIMAIIGLVGNLLIQFGVAVDINWMTQTAQIICNIMLIMGIANNPTTQGLDLPGGSSSAADSASTPTGANDPGKVNL